MPKNQNQRMFSICQTIFNVNDIDSLMEELPEVKTNKKITYINAPFAFDIETTSFYKDDEKRATMYVWVLGINGKCIIGRTWDEFLYCINRLAEHYETSALGKRLIIYVHNLAYEFQWIQHYFEWDSVFSLDDRKPVKALTTSGIEFRCSYILSGYALASVGKNLTKYKVEKMVGDLDYRLLRHTQTPLTDKELGYVLNDGLVVMAYIQEQIESCGDITRIPLTKTGYVRKYCRDMCLYEGSHKHNVRKYLEYRDLIHCMNITSLKEFNQLQRAFQGGFTHCNALYTGVIMKDVTSYDFTSSYPAVMVMEQFPMSSGELVKIKDKDELIKYLNLYCCLFDAKFTNIKQRDNVYDNPISSSKCWDVSGDVVNNGRVVKADELSITLTDVDFKVLTKFYEWDSLDIWNFRIYKKGYLPTDFIKAILKLYHDKTTLKGIDDLDTYINYMKSKENLNSCYGMAVTNPCRSEVTYESGEWNEIAPDYEKQLKKYNDAKNRFLFYAWGVWVTAYARYNLFTGIYNVGKDYVYADTDSIKCINMDKHMDYIERYNKRVDKKLENAMKYHKLDIELVRPKTIKGKEKVLGYWDYDGFYNRFKTLGAKRYMVEHDDELSLTISGLSKYSAVPYLKYKYGDNTAIFNAFEMGMYIPSEYKDADGNILSGTGKNIHTYIDYAQSGELTDYLGNTAHYGELSSVHMEGAEYSLSLASDYIDYLMEVKEFIE